MWRNVLAIIGVLVFAGGVVLLTVEVSQQQSQMAFFEDVRIAEVVEYRAAILAGAGILLGPILTIPWWRDRLRQEEQWFEKREEPVDGPPRVPN